MKKKLQESIFCGKNQIMEFEQQIAILIGCKQGELIDTFVCSYVEFLLQTCVNETGFFHANPAD